SITQSDPYTFSGKSTDVILVASVATSGLLCPQADVYDASGNLIGSGPCNSGSGSIALTSTGMYTIKVHDRNYANKGSYNLNLQFATGDCAASITCGQVKSGNIMIAQQDAYSIAANANEAVVLTTLGTSGGVCARTRLFDPSGAQVYDSYPS